MGKHKEEFCLLAFLKKATWRSSKGVEPYNLISYTYKEYNLLIYSIFHTEIIVTLVVLNAQILDD